MQRVTSVVRKIREVEGGTLYWNYLTRRYEVWLRGQIVRLASVKEMEQMGYNLCAAHKNW
jgi:hypothetical protein